MSDDNELFEKGLKVRREVLGAAYVDGSLAKADDFMMAFQHITTEMCWGYAWTRPGLDRRTRSIINLAMLTALSKPSELKLHMRPPTPMQGKPRLTEQISTMLGAASHFLRYVDQHECSRSGRAKAH